MECASTEHGDAKRHAVFKPEVIQDPLRQWALEFADWVGSNRTEECQTTQLVARNRTKTARDHRVGPERHTTDRNSGE